MMKKYKKVFLLLVFVIIVISASLLVGSYAKYLNNDKYDKYLRSKNFYFYSDLLTINNKEYNLDNWNGISYDLDIELYNYDNLASWTDRDIEYDVSVSCSSNIECSLDTASNDTLVYSAVSSTTNNIGISITASDEDIQSASVSVSVTSKSPYKKTLSAVFNLSVSSYGVSYEVEDSDNSTYARLVLKNTTSDSKSVTLSFEDDVVSPDNTNEKIIKSISNNSYELKNGVYTITLEIDANSDMELILYKKDISKNYTYPSGGESIVNVS